MRVLFLTNIPSPYRVDFFNELGKYCDLTVTFEGEKATDRDSKWISDKFQNFSAVFLPGIRVRADAFICFGIIRILKQKWDRIIISGYSTPTDMLAIEYLRSRRIPFYIEADGGIIGNDKKLVYAMKKHFISSASEWFSSGVVTTNYLVHYGADEKRCHMYPFTSLCERDFSYMFKDETGDSEKVVILKKKRALAKKSLEIKDAKMILAVGQFIHRKGFDLLIQALEGIKGVTTYIVGGKKTEEYESLVEKHHVGNIFFVDFLTKKQIEQYYLAADLFVLPTREDIWGLVINEAMMYALPVITTDRCVSGLELVKEGINGHIVPVNNVSLLHDRIESLIKDDERLIDMGIMAHNSTKGYTIEAMAKAHMRCLREIHDENSK